MNYFGFAKDKEAVPQASFLTANDKQKQDTGYDWADPVLRRYYYWKYGLQAAMLAVGAGVARLLIENL